MPRSSLIPALILPVRGNPAESWRPSPPL